MSAPTKITYTSACGDLEEFHQRFDVALEAVAPRPGARIPSTSTARRSRPGAEPLVDRSPIDTGLVLGRFAPAGPADVDRAVAAARAAQRGLGPAPLARPPRPCSGARPRSSASGSTSSRRS